jgi:hypothetical protein
VINSFLKVFILPLYLKVFLLNEGYRLGTYFSFDTLKDSFCHTLCSLYIRHIRCISAFKMFFFSLVLSSLNYSVLWCAFLRVLLLGIY